MRKIYRPIGFNRVAVAATQCLRTTTITAMFCPQLLGDEAEELLEEDEELSKSESLHDSSQSSRVSASSLAQPPLAPRSLKKSTAFHDRTTLEQQVQYTMVDRQMSLSTNFSFTYFLVIFSLHENHSQTDITTSIVNIFQYRDFQPSSHPRSSVCWKAVKTLDDSPSDIDCIRSWTARRGSSRCGRSFWRSTCSTS